MDEVFGTPPGILLGGELTQPPDNVAGALGLRDRPLQQIPHDIGWLHDLQVAKLMRQDFAMVPPQMPLAELRRQFPITESRRVFVVNENGGNGGCLDLVETHGDDLADSGDRLTAGDIARDAEHFLTPGQPVRETLDLFIAAAAEVLAVVD